MKHVDPDDIRMLFSRAMSDMYRAEVPQYDVLLELIADVNDETLRRDPDLKTSLERAGELDRLNLERHGAIRLGTAQELAAIRRVFAVMGMHPVGYYDLSVAGIPVHSTAFRPINDESLRRSPFRVFASLLRLELIEDEGLRAEATAILAARRILTPRAIELVSTYERQGSLTMEQAEEFVREALETFRWNGEATVAAETYNRLNDAHRLIADVVSFKGPHINHLTPRTLDIDAAQAEMPKRGIAPKAVIEGPPRRKCAILLRQTSFKALEESVAFKNATGVTVAGAHTARFGEIEQRGAALTPKGRKIYDELLASVHRAVQVGSSGANADYAMELAQRFETLPDDWSTLRAQGLAFFRYSATTAGIEAARRDNLPRSIEALIANGFLRFDPIVYEDFLPVSAAGIFRSNLDGDAQHGYGEGANRAVFEEALGQPVLDECDLYARAEKASLDAALDELGLGGVALKSIV
ncbi:MAG TPA: VOC family protein [Methylocella sp.]|nr:VOC family protein [Methylocella sp.]